MTSVNKNTRINAHFFTGSTCFEQAHHLEAIKHFKVGISENSACCKVGLSHYYGQGLCVRKDTVLAKSLYCGAIAEGALSLLESCEPNNVQALLWRGLIAYWMHDDLVEARRLLESSSELGNAYATYFLGRMYYVGKGVKVNTEFAIKLYEKAVEQSSECFDAFYSLARICDVNIFTDRLFQVSEYYGIELPGSRDVDFDEGKVEKDMIKYYVKAAENGHARAACNLATYYRDLEDLEFREVKALKWYRKSADAGYFLAFFKLGNLYEEGIPEENLERACEYYDLGTQLCHASDLENDGYDDVARRLIRSKNEAKKYCVGLLESGVFFTRMPRICLAQIIVFALKPIRLRDYGNIITLTVEQVTSVICKVSH